MARKQWTRTRVYRVCLRILSSVYLMLNILATPLIVTASSSLTVTREEVPYRLFLSFQIMMSVHKCGLASLVLIMEGPNLVKLLSFAHKPHKLIVRICIYMVAAMTGSLM